MTPMECGWLGSSCSMWLQMILFLFWNVLIWAVWFFGFLGRGRGVLPSAVAAQICSLTQIVLSQMLLGVAWLLYPVLLFTLNTVVCIAVFFLFTRPYHQAAVVSLKLFWNDRKRDIPWIVLLLCVFVLIRAAVQAFFLPPRDWDGIVLHLPIAAYFYQAHAVFPLDSPIIYTRGYAFDGELLSLWNFFFFHLDKFADMPFLVSIAFGAMAIFGSLRAWGSSREAAAMGAGIFLFAPATIAELVGTHNDAYLASLFAMGLFMVVSAQVQSKGSGKGAAFLLTAAVAGLMAGTKFTGLIYATAILMYAGWVLSSDLRRKGLFCIDSIFRRARWIGIAGVLIFTLAAYPYIRNIVRFGNPLFPFSVEVGGVEILPGERHSSELMTSNTPQEYLQMNPVSRLGMIWMELTPNYFEGERAGLGPLWLVLAVPALMIWIVWILWRRDGNRIVLLAAMTLAVLATPAFWVPRYGILMLLPGAYAVGWMADMLAHNKRRVMQVVFVCGAAWAVVHTTSLNEVSPILFWKELTTRSDATRSSVPYMWDGNGVFTYIETHTIGEPSVISYGGLVRYSYSLWGADFRNTVVNLPLDSEQDWNAALDREQVRFVVVQQTKPQYEWMQRNPAYQFILEDNQIVVFERRADSHA